MTLNIKEISIFCKKNAFTDCVDCNKTYPAGCPDHVTTYKHIEDATDLTRARSSLPDQLALRTMYNRNSPDFMGI